MFFLHIFWDVFCDDRDWDSTVPKAQIIPPSFPTPKQQTLQSASRVDIEYQHTCVNMRPIQNCMKAQNVWFFTQDGDGYLLG